MSVIAEKFLIDNPEFFKSKPDFYEISKDVSEQAKRHFCRDADNSLIEKKRPFEHRDYKDYRDDNHRLLTYQGIWELMNISVRVLSELSTEDFPESFQRYDSEKPYVFNGAKMDLDTYIYRCILSMCFKDPNAVTVVFPYNRNNPDIPPQVIPEEGGLPRDTIPDLDYKIFTFDEIIYLDNDIFAFKGGYKILSDNSKEPFFYVADYLDWYIYEPVSRGQDGVEYIFIRWYNHNQGQLPINFIPGILSIGDDGTKYREAFCWNYYEYADEFDARFQDDQVVHTRFAYPREIQIPMECPTCNGTTKVKGLNEQHKEVAIPCDMCKGTGMVVTQSVFDVTLRPTDDSGKYIDKVLELITPDVGILEHTTGNAFDILDRGRKTIGLADLEGVQESGEAKKLRLENRQLVLLNICLGVIEWKETHINNVLALIDPGAESITIKKPQYIAIKSEDVLIDRLNSSPRSNKYQATIDYYSEIYKHDPYLFKIHKLSLDFAPLLLMSEQEQQLRLNEGAYDYTDLIRADFAVWAFTQLVETENFLGAAESRLLEEAEKLIQTKIPVKTPVTVPLIEEPII